MLKDEIIAYIKAIDPKDQMRRGIRNAVRGLWNGSISSLDFYDFMSASIRRGITAAWEIGIGKAGILPDEMSEIEREALNDFLEGQYSYIDGFADEILHNLKVDGGKLQPLFDRAELWIGRFDQAIQVAFALAGQDMKAMWTLGEAEHCRSCLKLEGKVKRLSYWYERGILPRVAGCDYLECKGYKCQCSLEPTDSPQSKGPLPGLP